ncbi:MAG: 2-hydroxyacid dehydrogenase [Rhodospirillales bacterium]|nr:2-hydroxyacid dehydrogenase [Alphaproteobacteria bacterium]MBL6929635.1 2-hydroxyacid dehydrogenase [Rhodospirillales bacterium]
MDTVLLTKEIQPQMKAILEGKYELYDMTGYEKVADIPGLDPATVRACVTKGETIFGADLMSQLPALEVISNYGVGYDGIDVAEAIRRGVTVTNTPNVLTDDTANMSLLLTLAVTRRLVELHEHVRDGEWETAEGEILATSIVGKVCGVVGLGRIGGAVAERLAACGAKVAYSDPIKQDVPYDYYADAASLAAASDVLVVSCFGGAGTFHLVNAEVLDALGPQGFLVNAARGSIVDEAALVSALKDGKIAGAGLDVFEDEPRVPAELRSMPNVVLTPHQGSGTHETRRRMAEVCHSNIEAFFAGKPVVTPVPEHSK